MTASLVDRLIEHSVRSKYASVRWRNRAELPTGQSCVLYANHHSWWDGYFMYLLSKELGLKPLLWMEEYGAFPLFGKVGAIEFPVGDAAKRAAALKRTVRLMRAEPGRVFLIFPEGKLHYPPGLLPFQPGFRWMCERLPDLPVVPVAISIQNSMQEHPEAFLSIGKPIGSVDEAETRLQELMTETERELECSDWRLLRVGRRSINERFDFRKWFRR